MRLSQQELSAITNAFGKYFIQGDKLWLFGSRADDQKKGGDIDLFVETLESDLTQLFDAKIAFLIEVKSLIGDQKIDVIIKTPTSQDALIYQEAKNTGIRLV